MATAPTQDFIVNAGLNVQGTATVTSSTGNLGALQVDGGAAVSQNLIVGTDATIYGDLTVYGSIPSVSITTGTFTNITVTDLSTLNAVTAGVTTATSLDVAARLAVGGLSQLNNATLANTTNSTSSTTGALTVAGGVGIEKDLWVGGRVYVSGYEVVTTATVIASTLQAVSEQGSTTTVALTLLNTSSSTSTTTGALVVSGGVGVGGSINVESTSYINGSKILTSADLVTITFTATFITNDPTSVSGLVTVAGTSTSYGTYNFGTVADIQTFNDYNTATNTGFYSINDASGAPGYIVYIGYTGISDFNRVVFNVNYTQNSGHIVNIDIYNFETLAWDTFAVYSGSPGWYQLALGVIDPAPYMSSGDVYTRIYHVSNGSPSHRTWIDYAALERSIQGGQGPRGATGAQGVQGPQGLTTTTTSTFLFNNYTESNSTDTGAVVVYGGVGIGKNLNVGKDLRVTGRTIFDDTVTFSGSATYVLSTNTFYTDNLIELHLHSSDINSVWPTDDGKDIGLRFHYYSGTDTNGALILANDSKYLVWYEDGNSTNTNVISDGVYGTFKTGAIILASTTGSVSTNTGALTVAGGVGIGGSIYVGSNATVTNNLVVSGTVNATSTTTGALTVAGGVGIGKDLHVGGQIVAASITATIITATHLTVLGSASIPGGLTATNFTTTELVVVGVATLNAFVAAIATVTNLTVAGLRDTGNMSVEGWFTASTATVYSLNILSNQASTSTTTGALVVAGGVGVGGSIWAGDIYSNGSRVLTSAGGGGYVSAINAGTDTAVSTSTGVITIWNTSTLQSVTNRGATTTNAISITNTTSSVSTTTGALKISGGIGVGGSIYVGNRVGFVGTTRASVVYQYYNAATNSLDTVFG
jgi:hypothetical protein